MDVGIVCKETLLVRMEEICSVIDGGLLRRSASEDFGSPCISMKRLDDLKSIEWLE